jgi:hypothetical protein
VPVAVPTTIAGAFWYSLCEGIVPLVVCSASKIKECIFTDSSTL